MKSKTAHVPLFFLLLSLLLATTSAKELREATAKLRILQLNESLATEENGSGINATDFELDMEQLPCDDSEGDDPCSPLPTKSPTPTEAASKSPSEEPTAALVAIGSSDSDSPSPTHTKSLAPSEATSSEAPTAALVNNDFSDSTSPTPTPTTKTLTQTESMSFSSTKEEPTPALVSNGFSQVPSPPPANDGNTVPDDVTNHNENGQFTEYSESSHAGQYLGSSSADGESYGSKSAKSSGSKSSKAGYNFLDPNSSTVSSSEMIAFKEMNSAETRHYRKVPIILTIAAAVVINALR